MLLAKTSNKFDQPTCEHMCGTGSEGIGRNITELLHISVYMTRKDFDMAHVTKYTKVASGHMIRHYERSDDIAEKRENIDETRTHLNYNLCGAGTGQERLKKRLEEVYIVSFYHSYYAYYTKTKYLGYLFVKGHYAPAGFGQSPRSYFFPIFPYDFFVIYIYILFIIFNIFKGEKKLETMLFKGFLLGVLVRFIGSFSTVYWEF